MSCFDIYQTKDGKWEFVLIDSEGKDFLYSVKIYENEQDAFLDARNIVEIAHISNRYFSSMDGEKFIFFIGQDNAHLLGKSKSYTKFSYCENAKEIVCNLASKASINNLKRLSEYMKAKEEGRLKWIEI